MTNEQDRMQEILKSESVGNDYDGVWCAVSAALRAMETYAAEAIRSREPKDPLPAETPQGKDDGWIEWKGGKCPLHKKEIVTVRFRDSERPTECCEAFRLRWDHWSTSDPKGRANDIVAYLPPIPTPESKADWRDVPVTAGLLADAVTALYPPEKAKRVTSGSGVAYTIFPKLVLDATMHTLVTTIERLAKERVAQERGK